jgi:hypothetical protein
MERQDPPQGFANPSCGECAHARIAGDDLGKRLCGRYPPQVFPMPAHGGVAALTMRPQVNTTDTACGEFKPKH